MQHVKGHRVQMIRRPELKLGGMPSPHLDCCLMILSGYHGFHASNKAKLDHEFGLIRFLFFLEKILFPALSMILQRLTPSNKPDRLQARLFDGQKLKSFSYENGINLS